jgi:hypothetical protein
MTVPQRSSDPIADLLRRVALLEQRQYAQSRGVGSGRHSLGVDALRPGRKLGTPSDADFTAATMPALATIIYDATGSKIWVRHAAGTWKGVVVA